MRVVTMENHKVSRHALLAYLLLLAAEAKAKGSMSKNKRSFVTFCIALK